MDDDDCNDNGNDNDNDDDDGTPEWQQKVAELQHSEREQKKRFEEDAECSSLGDKHICFFGKTRRQDGIVGKSKTRFRRPALRPGSRNRGWP